MVTTDTSENKRFGKKPDTSKRNQTYFSEKGKASLSYQYFAYEVDEDYKKQNKMRKIADSRVKKHAPEEDETADLTDKLEVIKRLEREKKAMQKKNREQADYRKRKPMPKQKRSCRDWTKDYRNGLLDEEVFL